MDEVAPDPDPFTPPPASESEWRETVWLPAHEMLATMAEAPAIAEHATTAHGNFACDASERIARRYGLDKIMQSGHWLADLILLVTYALALKKGIEAEQAESDAHAETQATPEDPPQEDPPLAAPIPLRPIRT